MSAQARPMTGPTAGLLALDLGLAAVLAVLWLAPGAPAQWRTWQAPQPQPPSLDDIDAWLPGGSAAHLRSGAEQARRFAEREAEQQVAVLARRRAGIAQRARQEVAENVADADAGAQQGERGETGADELGCFSFHGSHSFRNAWVVVGRPVAQAAFCDFSGARAG